MNRLYRDIFVAISFAMFMNFLADTYSPKIRFRAEYAPSTAHLSPYLFACLLPPFEVSLLRDDRLLPRVASLRLPGRVLPDLDHRVDAAGFEEVEVGPRIIGSIGVRSLDVVLGHRLQDE